MRGVSLMVLGVMLAGCASPPPVASGVPVRLIGGEQANLFDPAVVHLVTEGSVTWRGESGHHTVTFERDVNGNGTAPESGDLGPGQVFTVSFPAAGTYAYRCRYHSGDFGAGKGHDRHRHRALSTLAGLRSRHLEPLRRFLPFREDKGPARVSVRAGPLGERAQLTL
jgi:plastocyanin